MLDRDLAELYGVGTKVLNQAVKRNSDRFPSSFMFALGKDEMSELVTNCDRFKMLKPEIQCPTSKPLRSCPTIIRAMCANS